MTQGSNELHFFYDAANKPAVVIYNGTAYAYVKNLQGDIIAILDQSGNAVVQYAYDAWGKPISTTGSMASTLGVINPFRYRGYVYDQETGLYYLRSRYYNAVWCRFANPDSALNKIRINAHNLFCYCRNKVIKHKDSVGFEDEEITLADLGVEVLVLEIGSYYRLRPIVEGVKATDVDSGAAIKIYTMFDDNKNAIDYCGQYMGGDIGFVFHYNDQTVALKVSDCSHIAAGDEWAYHMGYNTESVAATGHRAKITTRNTVLALAYATNTALPLDGTFSQEAYDATLKFQSSLAGFVEGMTVDGWPGKTTKPWLLQYLLDAWKEEELNPPV